MAILISTYTTKPRTIEAVQINEYNMKEVLEWVERLGGVVLENNSVLTRTEGVRSLGLNYYVVHRGNGIFDVLSEWFFKEEYEFDSIPK